MSLILDALRKSDHERSQQRAPDIARSGQPAAEQPRQRWLLPVVALLLINLAVLGYIAWPRAAANDPVPPAAASAGAAAPVAAREQPSRADAALTQPREPRAEPARRAEVRPLAAETVAAPTAAARASDAAVPAATAASAAADTAFVPTLTELRADGSVTLDDIAMELHVFSEQPDKRFIFVRGRKLTEGQALDNGARIEAITPDGAIMRFNGRRFLVQRR